MNITSANAVLMLSQPDLFPTPQQIQGFSADDIYSFDQIASVETSMGVDGVLSGGFVFQAAVQSITLQADSESNDFFEVIWNQMQAARNIYPLFGLISLSSISTKFVMNKGLLTGFPPIADAKRILQPRRYSLTWERVQPAPI